MSQDQILNLESTISHLTWLTTVCEDEPDSSEWVDYAESYKLTCEEYKKFLEFFEKNAGDTLKDAWVLEQNE